MSFVPHAQVVEAKDGTPSRTAYVLHGILGSGRNWRTLTRRLIRSDAPGSADTRYVLVDLRNHGQSQGAPGPHSVTTAADDLLALHAVHGAPDVIIGHSFGGKVAMRYAQRHPQGLERVWVLDSRAAAEPPAPDNDVAMVIAALGGVPQPLARREDLVEHMTSRGFSPSLAQWLTTNLRRAEDGLRFVFELDAIRAMIADYWSLDLWDLLRDPPCPIEVVRAGRSDRWPDEVLERFTSEASPLTRLHVLPNAGHWVHVDDPEGLIRLLTQA